MAGIDSRKLMSQIAAYLGARISLKDFLITPSTSLFQQARTPREHTEPSPDGFGIGWYFSSKPYRYLGTHPVWNDLNLPALANTMTAPLWLASIQSIEVETAMNPSNIQPFHDRSLHFMHHGFIADFHRGFKPNCLRYLSAEIAADINGNSDSEYLFALLRQRLLDPDHVSVEVALQDILSTLEVSLRDTNSSLNIIVSDGRKLIAARHATNQECDTLYFTSEDTEFPGAQLVSTTPLTDSPGWQAVPEHHLLVIQQDFPPELTRL